MLKFSVSGECNDCGNLDALIAGPPPHSVIIKWSEEERHTKYV